MFTRIGKKLENYKTLYLAQPKLVRIFALPALTAVTVFLFENGASVTTSNKTMVLSVCALLVWNAYNQFLEAITYEREVAKREELQDELRSSKTVNGELLSLVEKNARLNDVFTELVSRKSEMWLDSVSEFERHGQKAAKEYIRRTNSLKQNIDRIVSSIRLYFDNYSDSTRNQSYRVTCFRPSKDGTRLELISWDNNKHECPKSSTSGSSAFDRGGQSLASFMWSRCKKQFFIIDDVPTYVKRHGTAAVFSYIDEAEIEKIRSIACYRVEDGISRACIGIICVDTNVIGGLGEILLSGSGTSHGDAQDSLTADVREAMCERILESFACRIVFETRFALMKETLKTINGQGKPTVPLEAP